MVIKLPIWSALTHICDIFCRNLFFETWYILPYFYTELFFVGEVKWSYIYTTSHLNLVNILVICHIEAWTVLLALTYKKKTHELLFEYNVTVQLWTRSNFRQVISKLCDLGRNILTKITTTRKFESKSGSICSKNL